MNFNYKGYFYRAWSKFIHKHGYHYAPKMLPIDGGLKGQKLQEWHYWCKWCGLRGKTLEGILDKDALND